MAEDKFIPDWSDTPLKRNTKIPLMVKQRAALAAKIKELEEERRTLGENLQALLVKNEIDVVAIEGFTPLRITTTRRAKVDDSKVKRALVEDFKVPPAKLAKLWEESTTYTTSSFIIGGAPSGQAE